MIKKLRLKFIVLSLIAVIVLLGIIVTSMNIINYHSVVQEADEILGVLSGNNGDFPKDFEMEANSDVESETKEFIRPSDFISKESVHDNAEINEKETFKKQGVPHWMSPETPYESRFFSVVLDENGEYIDCNLSRIASVSEEEAISYATTVYSLGDNTGFLDEFRYTTKSEINGTRIIFLDCGRKLEAFRSFMEASLMMAGTGLILFFVVIFVFSKRIVQPVAEAYEKQKRFISDAGHEIKTPLTIIKADADILEMDHGTNEWIEDIQKQTERLTDLTNDLIFLSKTEEGASSMNMIEFPVSDVVEEMTESFDMLARSQNKNINKNIEKGLSLKGDEKAIGQLVSILLDNAIKYSPENGSIDLTLSGRGKGINLTVSNATENEIDKDSLKLLFERFYRPDASRNSKTGGYGIGLSMAKAIVEVHGGKIYAKLDKPNELSMIAEIG